MISAAEIYDFKGAPLRKACTFLFLFFTFFGDGFGQSEPSFNFYDDIFLGNGGYGTEANIVVSVDTDSEGNIYILTFGKGVFKIDPISFSKINIITDELGAPGKLNAPLDLAIDNNNILHIADSGSKLIKKFDTSGNSQGVIGVGVGGNGKNEFWEPTGLEFDNENNLYVVDAYRGNNSSVTERHFLKIYYSNGGFKSFQGTSEHPLNNPYRVAANDDYILISHAQNNGEILVFNKDLTYKTTLDNIGSPGSIFIDKSNFIYAIDYSNKIDFTQVLRLFKGDVIAVLQLYPKINEGINNGDFKIQVYNADLTYNSTLNDYPVESDNIEDDHIQFPIDVALDSNCGWLYLNDASINGLSLDFNLEIYTRTPSYDHTLPSITCPSDIVVDAEPGNDYAVVNYTNATATDVCGVTLNRTSGLASGSQFQVGENTVEFTATDSFGNFSTCSLKITVNPAEDTDEPPLFTNCPSNITADNDSGQCGAIVTFEALTVTDDGGEITPTRIDNSGLNSGDVFPVGVTTITFQADDGVNEPVTCSFTITVEDNEAPAFTDCPASNTTISLSEGETYPVPNYRAQINFSDNCDSELSYSQIPAAGTEIDETTPVTITVTDDAGLKAECSFNIIVEQVEEFNIQCVENYTAELGYNNGIIEIPTTELIIGDTSGIEFDIEIQQFSCEDIGEKSITINATKTETGETASCIVNVKVVDTGRPLIVCPAEEQYREIPASGVFELPEVVSLGGIADNCSPDEDLVIVQDPPPGTEFTEEGDYEIILTATDPYNNTETCTVIYSLTRANTLSLDCPADYEIPPNNNCEYIVPDFSEIVTFSPPDATITQSIPEGTILYYDQGQDITVTASYEGNEVVCKIPFIPVDEAPVLACPSGQIITVAEGENAHLPDYSNLLEVYNCGNVEIVQDPVAGTQISGETEVTFIVTDSANREVRCSFNVTVADENTLELVCPGDYEVFADENCQYLVPDFSEIVNVSPEGATIQQSMEAGSTTITNADPFVTITATFDGKTETCEVYLLLKDEIPPEVRCPPGETITLAEGESFSLTDYRDQLEISENCETVDIIQDPLPGTEINRDTQVSFLITDEAGNTTDCSFELSVITEDELAISCPADKTENLNENCSFTVPDYTAGAQVSNGEGVEIIQTPEAGTQVTGDGFEVALRVEKNGEFDECTFFVSLEDDIAPVARCIAEFQVSLSQGEIVIIDPEQIDSGSSDNCGDIELSLSKTEFTSADEGETTVTLRVTDAAGNTSTCEAVVEVSVNSGSVNDPPVAYDEEYTTGINTTLNVSASNGVLVNDTDPENDELIAILDTDAEFGSLQLNPDGSFTYTPDTGFVGQDFFTYVANDGEFNSNTIFVSINVVDNSGEFGCNSQAILSLGPEGQANLDLELLYHGNAEGLEITADQLVFTCNDIGENLVILSYSGRLEGSCEIPVTVVDEIPPVLQLRDISIDLDLQGNANITFEDIDNGSFDQCSVAYTLSKTMFTCKDLGDNIIQVTAVDDYGNTVTENVRVRVFAEAGICSETPVGTEYIYLYPNPNTGSFKIATPADVTIHRVEVFDNRGRFIIARDYDSTVGEYFMETGPLQEAVYVLKLLTNEGVYIKRMIFKN